MNQETPQEDWSGYNVPRRGAGFLPQAERRGRPPERKFLRALRIDSAKFDDIEQGQN
jgi:hypothetical protein